MLYDIARADLNVIDIKSLARADKSHERTCRTVRNAM